MSRSGDNGCCSLCGRRTELTFHHLVPRKVHRRTYFRKHFDRQALSAGIEVCRLCHTGLHRLYDEMTLARRLCSLTALRADPAIRRHVQWVRKQRESNAGA
ncbi:MAG: hypothetical protein H6953_08055 [Chromatiaceae bacterium]|nr:hypothetical protein [Gammaproteobacteria bacterium]MCP5305385.1 hypothetical protein [Chromatiaceae bacterium]MCP5315344.1 hypothetical protein [Chromatiaceae bacterium]